MEPPVKRRRLGENPQSWHDEGNDEEEWEEYDGDEDIEEEGSDRREGSVEQDDSYQLAIEKAYADNRFRATMAHIYEKYGRDFEGIGDEIDLSTGEIVVNNGHIQNMRNEVDVGDGPTRNDQNGGELEVAEDDGMDDEDANQSWTSDLDDTEVTLNNLQLQRSGPFGPNAVDGIPGPDPTVDGSPNMISRLYGGGGLRYASSLGEFGASPFALGPWDLLPQAQDRYEFPEQDGLSSIWAPDYCFNDNEPDQRTPMRARLGLSRARPRAKKLKALPSAKTQNGGRRGTIGTKKRLGNAREEQYNDLVDRQRTKRMGKVPSWVDDMDESDTNDDAVFSDGESTSSSETGDTTDEVPRSKIVSTVEPSNRVIPDSQESYVSQETVAAQPAVKPPLQPNEAKHKGFESACLLSDDESPIFSLPFGPATNINLTESAKAPEKATGAIPPSINPDGTAVKRGRGRPRKYPPGYRPPRGPRKKPKPNLPTLPELTQTFAILTPTPIRTEAVPGVKRKRGRPRKYPPRETLPQQNPTGQNVQHPNIQQPFQGSMHQPFLPAFQPGVPQSPYQYPFQGLFQQPVYQFPHQLAYQQLQQSYIQQHMYQLQQQIIQQPIQQLIPQPMLPTPYQTQPQIPTQPVKRKRGRPRKHPVRFDSVYPGYVMNRKRTTSKNMYDGMSAHQQLPGLRNSMTALVSGQPGRIMVSEDAWYGVARQLAQDISCLQGGSLFAGQFHDGTQTSSKKRPGPSSKNTDQSTASLPLPQDADDRPVRVTELSEVSDVEIAQPEYISRNDDIYPALGDPALADQTLIETGMIDSLVDEEAVESDAVDPAVTDSSLIEPDMSDSAFANRRLTDLASVDSAPSDSDVFDLALVDPALTGSASVDTSSTEPATTRPVLVEEDVFDPALVDPALLAEGIDSPMDDDDAGFVSMESPKSATKNLQLTPSPPSPPPSIQRSSPLKAAEGRTPTPVPAPLSNSHTPTSLQPIKSPTPTSSHKSDEYDLPSSPEAVNVRVPTPVAPISPSEDVAMEPDDPIDGQHKFSLEAQETDSSPLESIDNVPELVESIQQLDEKVQRPQEPAEEQPESTGRHQGNQAMATPDARAERSPTVTRPQTPEPQKSVGTPKQTPKKSSERRQSMVPRSAERCTPIFMEPSLFVESPPRSHVRKQPTIQRRTMGELKQAVIEPWQKLQEPKPAIRRPKSNAVGLESARPSMSTKLRTPLPHGNRHHSSASSKTENSLAFKPSASRPSASASKPSTFKLSTTELSTSKPIAPWPSTSKLATSKASVSRPSTSKPSVPQFSFSNVAKKPTSRRSLLSLASGDDNSKDLDDEDDELGSPGKSILSSVAKSSKPLPPNELARDQIRKSSSRAAESHHKPAKEKERAKDKGAEKKKKKKKRRHTDGSTDKECGVDGYTCNKDFCFTCL